MEKAPDYKSIYYVNRSVDETLQTLSRLKKRTSGPIHTAIVRMMAALEEQRATVNAQFTEFLAKRERNDEQRLNMQLRNSHSELHPA